MSSKKNQEKLDVTGFETRVETFQSRHQKLVKDVNHVYKF